MSLNELRRMAAKMDQHIQQLADQDINDPHVIIDRMVAYVPDLNNIWIGSLRLQGCEPIPYRIVIRNRSGISGTNWMPPMLQI
jgi:hypothetical protein